MISESGSSHATGLPTEPAEGPSLPVSSAPAHLSPQELIDRTVITQRTPAPLAGGAPPTSPGELGKLLAGERLDHFELKEFVGGGGMGAVFRALDTMLNREVALKVLSRDQGADDETRRRFQNEAQSAARLDHENIARVYYVGEDRGLNYIVFEFIEGINLRELVEQRGALPIGEALSYTLQVAEAIAHASSRDVVHRDIKPSNVIVTSEGRAKLVDMGLARLHQVERSAADLTASGVTLGTFDYISPEQAYDPRSADVRSDIYSLGCTLYFMLTARPPFPQGTVLQKLLQHKSDTPPDPREINPSVPEAVSAVVMRMLAKDPRKRQQSAAELIRDLMVLAERHGVAPLTGLSTAWTGAPRRVYPWEKHLPWVIPVALLLLVVVLLDSRWTGTKEDIGWPAVWPPATQPNPSTSEGPGASDRKSDDAVGKASGRALSSAGRSQPGEVSGESGTTSKTAANASQGELSPSSDSEKVTGSHNSPIAQDDDLAMQLLANLFGREKLGALVEKLTSSIEQAVEALPRPKSDLLIVTDSIVGDGYYPSLRAAVNAAQDGDVIELCYTGRRDEMPFTISNRRITVRAGLSFRPVIAFRPINPNPLVYAHSMITVAGGELRLVNVHLLLDVVREVPFSRWSLFETQLAKSLQLEGCLITVRNASDQLAAYHQGVSILTSRAAPGADMMMSRTNAPRIPVEIKLENCLVRGEALFLRARQGQAIELTWRNGILATTERLLSAEGHTTQPASGSTIQLTLAHLTVAARNGLARLTGTFDAPWLPPLSVRAKECIFVIDPGSVLIEQTGTEVSTSLQKLLDWEGDKNFYLGSSNFWKITDISSAGPPVELPFSSWRDYWRDLKELKPTLGGVDWRSPPHRTRPVHLAVPNDYRLSDNTVDNAARHGASDALDAGVNLQQLGHVLKSVADELAVTSQ